MLDYTLLLATRVPASSIGLVVERVMSSLGGRPAQDGTLTALVMPPPHPITAEVERHVIGRDVDADVYLGVDNKVEEFDHDEAHRRVAMVAAALASELDAEACFLFDLEVVAMRRIDGSFVLHDWFGFWDDPAVLATVRDPFRTTSEKEYF